MSYNELQWVRQLVKESRPARLFLRKPVLYFKIFYTIYTVQVKIWNRKTTLHNNKSEGESETGSENLESKILKVNLESESERTQIADWCGWSVLCSRGFAIYRALQCLYVPKAPVLSSWIAKTCGLQNGVIVSELLFWIIQFANQ